MKQGNTEMTFTFDANIFSDLHKEVYGFRPRGHWFYDAETTDAERQAEWDYLCTRLDQQIEEDRAREAKAVEFFEAQVQQNVSFGASDRETAIRWILQALNLDENDLRYGGGRICYEMGLPYSMAPQFDPIMKEMA